MGTSTAVVFITFWAAFVCLQQSIPHATLVHKPRCSQWWSKTLAASLYIDSSTPVTSGGVGTGAFWCWQTMQGYWIWGSLSALSSEASLHCSHWTRFVLFSYCNMSIAEHHSHTQEVERWTVRDESSRGWKQGWTTVKYLVCQSVSC